MDDATILRLTTIGAAVIVIIVAGCVGASSVHRGKTWWSQAMGVGLAVFITYIGFELARKGYFMGYGGL